MAEIKDRLFDYIRIIHIYDTYESQAFRNINSEHTEVPMSEEKHTAKELEIDQNEEKLF
jgi:hypothetical protein